MMSSLRYGPRMSDRLPYDVAGLALNLSYFLWEVGFEGIYCPPIPTLPTVTCTGKSPP